MAKMRSDVFVQKLKDIAQKYATLYVNGCFGAPLTSQYAGRYFNNTSYNRKPERQEILRQHINTNPTTFGFDCVCLIKGVLWGWNGATDKPYGGAKYASNGVPDVGTEEILNYCTDVTSTFKEEEMVPGELLWRRGHVGIYIGDCLAVECTPAWEDGVQITSVGNLAFKKGYEHRNWNMHGKLSWVDYNAIPTPTPAPTPAPAPTPTPGGKTVVVTLPVLKKGMKVEAVKTLQRILSSLGYTGTNGKVIAVDGSFGGSTNKAVGEFQSRNGLAVDYSVGNQTWNKLLDGSQR